MYDVVGRVYRHLGTSGDALVEVVEAAVAVSEGGPG